MFTLSNLPSGSTLPALKEWTAGALRAAQVQVQTLWNKQHKADGSHGDVTATRMRAGQIGGSGIYHANEAAQTLLSPLVIPPRITVVRVKTLTGGTPVDVEGIQQEGAQYGDIIAIGVADIGSPADLQLHFQASTVPVGTQITWDTLFYATNPLVLTVASGRSPLLLMYLPTHNLAIPAWCILRGLTP